MLRPVLAGLLLALLTACGSAPASGSDASPAAQLPAELLAPRAQYDTSRPFLELVKPHFYIRHQPCSWVSRKLGGGFACDLIFRFARHETPDRIVEREGKVKLRFREGGEHVYLDPLALESGLLGEHPVHKIFRLQAMGVPVERRLARQLRAGPFPHHVFQTITFEYLPGKEASGVITDVFPDGTFLVIPFVPPQEWLGDPPGQPGLATPSHLHVNARALISKTSAAAQEFEAEILALPFDSSAIPPPPWPAWSARCTGRALMHGSTARCWSRLGTISPPSRWFRRQKTARCLLVRR